MALYTFTELTYAIVHSDDGYIQFSEMPAGTALETPRTVELFTDETAAKARAEELGYVFVDPDDLLPVPELP